MSVLWCVFERLGQITALVARRCWTWRCRWWFRLLSCLSSWCRCGRGFLFFWDHIYELGIAQPFSAASIAAPTILSSSSVPPFVVVVYPCVVIINRGILVLTLLGWQFDMPFTVFDPLPLRHTTFYLGQFEMCGISCRIQMFISPRIAFVGEHACCPAYAQPSSLILIQGKCKANTFAGLGVRFCVHVDGTFYSWSWGQRWT